MFPCLMSWISARGNLISGLWIVGFYLSFLAKQIDSILWSIVADALGGKAMIV